MIRKIVGVIIISLGIGLIGFGAYGMFLGVNHGGFFILTLGSALILVGWGCLRYKKVQDLIDDLFFFGPA